MSFVCLPMPEIRYGWKLRWSSVHPVPHAPLRERKIRDERAPAIGVQQCDVRLHMPWNGNCHFNVTGLGGEDT